MTENQSNDHGIGGLSPRSSLIALRRLVEGLSGVDRSSIVSLLSGAEKEFDKLDTDRDVIGGALDEAVELLKQADVFTDVVDSLEPYVERVVDWLGSDWLHITNVLRSKELGERFPVDVVPYDPLWRELFEEERRFLESEFGPKLVVRIEHFGSTAVAGLAAKPVIDVLVGIPSFEVAQREIKPTLEKLGYIYFWRSDNPPGHVMFVKGYDDPKGQKYHLHMAPEGHVLWERLLFRDFLRDNPEVAKQYEELKTQLAKSYRHDREAYTNGKTDFVIEVTEKAKLLAPKR